MTSLKKYPTTLILTCITCLVFLSMQFFYYGNAESPLVIYNFGGLIGKILKVNLYDFWRLLSPIFVHIGWEHFLFNTITLYFLGQIAEELYGHFRFLLLYLLSGIMGNVFVLLFTPEVIVAGASTSIFGLFAAIMVTGYFSHNSYLQKLSNTYRTLIIINLIFNLVTPNVSIVGHLGGLLGGLLLGIGLSSNRHTKLTMRIRIMSFIVYIVSLIGIISFALTH